MGSAHNGAPGSGGWHRGVAAWRQQGAVYLWRYVRRPKSRRGWHVHADDAGCASLVELFQLMLASEWPVKRRIAVTPGRPAVGPSDEWRSVRDWRVVYGGGDVAPDHWTSEEADGMLVVTVGRTALVELREAFEGLPRGWDDYCLGPLSDSRDASSVQRAVDEALWFWARDPTMRPRRQ